MPPGEEIKLYADQALTQEVKNNAMFSLSPDYADHVSLWYDTENASENIQYVICHFDNGLSDSGPFKVSVNDTDKRIKVSMYGPANCDGNLHKLVCDFKYLVGTNYVTYQTITIYIQSPPSLQVTYGPNNTKAANGDSIALSLSEPYEENTQIVFNWPTTVSGSVSGGILFDYLDQNGEVKQTSLSSLDQITTTKIWVRNFNRDDGPEFHKEIVISYFGTLTVNYTVEA